MSRRPSGTPNRRRTAPIFPSRVSTSRRNCRSFAAPPASYPRMVVEAEAALLAANAAIYQRGVLVRPAEVEYPHPTAARPIAPH